MAPGVTALVRTALRLRIGRQGHRVSGWTTADEFATDSAVEETGFEPSVSLSLLTRSDPPLVVFRTSGSPTCYRYRRDVLGMDEAQARAEMEAIWHPEGVWAAFVDR
jgi:hypothetical protein